MKLQAIFAHNLFKLCRRYSIILLETFVKVRRCIKPAIATDGFNRPTGFEEHPGSPLHSYLIYIVVNSEKNCTFDD